MKRAKNRVVAFVLSFFILCGAVLSVPAPYVYATEPVTALTLAKYILTVTGVIKVGDNIVERVTDNQLHSLEDVITTCLGDGSIYVSSNGDYVFNSDATSAIYETLTNDVSKNAKVVSSFSNWESIIDNSYVDSDFYTNLNNIKNEFSTYMLVMNQYTNQSSINTTVKCYDVSNVSFILLDRSNGNISYDGVTNVFLCRYFYNSSGNNLAFSSVPCRCFYSTYYRGNVYTSSISSYTEDNAFLFSVEADGYNNCTFSGNYTLDDFYDLCPNFSEMIAHNNNRSFISILNGLIYANRSMVFAISANAGNTVANQSTGIIYNNYYDIIPSVSETVLNDNNWENIYNSYITTVNNEYQTIYEDNGSVSVDEIRAILKSVGDRIADIITDAGGEIEENLDDILTWLQRIYDRLGQIEEGLAGSGADLTQVEEYLASLENMIDAYSDDLDNLQRIYALCGQILQAINARGRGYPDIVMTLPDVDDIDITEYISKVAVLMSLLETVMPFCLVPLVGTLINYLGTTPVCPVLHIPISMHNSFIDIEEDLIVDFACLQSLRDMLVYAWVIGFILILIWLTFYLHDLLCNIFF